MVDRGHGGQRAWWTEGKVDREHGGQRAWWTEGMADRGHCRQGIADREHH